jgi:hypothetical protein
MTKKHFEALALIISATTDKEHPELISKRLLIKTLCLYFKTQNSNFNAEIFKRFCVEELP